MQHLGNIDDLLRAAVDAGHITGAVAMATTGTETIYRAAFGRQDITKPDPMTEDTVFWIASMTKAITSAAAMQLVEQGKLSLDASIGDMLPEFASPQVLEGFDEDGAPLLRPAKAVVTLRHLLTHTAGFCYDMWNGNMLRYLTTTKLPRIASGQRTALQMPLAFDPGTRWEYGINIDIVGPLVQEASGVRLDRYLQDNLFAPLAMTDTAFGFGEPQRQRRAAMHARGADGSLKPIKFELAQDPELHMGGGGLCGTAPDYIRFMRMILNNGSGSGQQILKSETVAMMAANHIGDLNVMPLPSSMAHLTNDVELFPGIVKKWSLGFLINTDKTPEGRSAGSMAWAGLANTYYWIDPERDIAGVIMMQVLPFADRQCLETFADFERGIYAGLDAAQKAA